VIAVIDTETTGLHPDDADIIQIAVILVNEKWEVREDGSHFIMKIKPAKFQETPEYHKQIAGAMSVNKLDLQEIMKTGFDSIRAAELFDEWWALQCQKQKITPLAQNWPFDRSFIESWLGRTGFKEMFDRYYLDTYATAAFLNHRADYMGNERPFKQGLGLGKLCNALGVVNECAHNAIYDAKATVACYKAMLSCTPIPKQ